jgi:YVTN family beta-propeller protein
MGYASHIGRVGALAVAMGIGVALGGTGVAVAQTDAGTASDAAAEHSSDPAAGPAANAGSQDVDAAPVTTGGSVDAVADAGSSAADMQTAADDDSGLADVDDASTDESTSDDSATADDDSVLSEHESNDTETVSAAEATNEDGSGGGAPPASDTDNAERHNSGTRLAARVVEETTTADFKPDSSNRLENSLSLSALVDDPGNPPSRISNDLMFGRSAKDSSLASVPAPMGSLSALTSMTTQFVANVLSPFIGSGPAGPGSAPVLWAVLAFARREIDKVVASLAPPASSTSTAQMLKSAVPETMLTTLAAPAAAAAPSPSLVGTVVVVVDSTLKLVTGLLGGLLGGNRAPTTNVTVENPDAAGVVRGNLGAKDPNNDPLTFTVTKTPTYGTVNVTGPAGAFTYTPSPRPDAPSHPVTDAFDITVSDGRGGTTIAHLSNVPSRPPNRAPNSGTFHLGTVDANGVIHGTVTATDPDNDTLTYGGSVDTLAHKVVVTPGGAVTYTPTAATRHAAATGGAAAQDSFTLTVSDGRGGTLQVPVTVNVTSDNKKPVNGAFHAADPDDSGTVYGTVTATDPDGDHLTFGGSKTTPDGTVTVTTDGDIGKFSYVPSTAARQHAAENPGPDTYGFDVTVDDGHGGTISVPVTVTVAPAASTPGTTIGEPDPDTGALVVSVTPEPGGGPLTTTGVTDPEHGTAVVNPDGSVTYTPDVDDRLDAQSTPGPDTDQFGVTVVDANGASSTVPVTVPIQPLETLAISTNDRPQWVAFNDDGSKAYISNESSGTITVVDTHTYQVLSTIPLGGQPSYIAQGPDGNFWVTNRSSNTVSVIDPNTDTVVKTLAVGHEPIGITFDPDRGVAYIANRDTTQPGVGTNGSVWVVRTSTYEHIATIPTPSPVFTALNHDKTQLWVTNQYDAEISVFDTRDYHLIRTIAVPSGNGNPPYPTSIQFNSDGTRAYYTNQFDDSLQVIDTTNYSVIKRIYLGDGATPVGLAINSDSSLAYVTNFRGRNHDDLHPGSISVIDLQTGDVIDNIPVGVGPTGATLNDDGDRLWVANAGGGITVIAVTPPASV